VRADYRGGIDGLMGRGGGTWSGFGCGFGGICISGLNPLLSPHEEINNCPEQMQEKNHQYPDEFFNALQARIR
jgi:hypothetical protein